MLHSYFVENLIDFAENNKKKKIIILEYEDSYDVINQITFIPDSCPNNKELRLALDLIDIMYPLDAKLPKKDKVDILKNVFKMNTSKEKLNRLLSHKDILTKQVICSIKNNKVKLKRVIKK